MTNDESYFKFEKLQVWQHARKFADNVYRITRDFPKSEQFGITNQLRKAATSIILNIAEGSERQSDADFQRFLRMALASTDEVVAALYISLDQKMLDQDTFNELRKDALHLSAQIKSFIKALHTR